MAIAIVNTLAVAGTLSGCTTTSLDTTGANLLFITVTWFVSGSPTFSDSKGNTWTQLSNYDDGAGMCTSSWYCIGGTVGSGHTFTHTGVAASIGVVTASGVGTFGSATGGTTVAASCFVGSRTTDEVNCLRIVSMGWNGSGHTLTVDSGFSETSVPGGPGAHFGHGPGWLIDGTAGALNPTAALSTVGTTGRVNHTHAWFRPSTTSGNRRRRVLLGAT